VESAGIEAALAELGFELVLLEQGGGRSRPRLRIRIDHAGAGRKREPVTVEDCALASRRLRTLLEEQGAEAENWVLEVSSPGVERPLVKARDFERFAGERVRVRGYAPLADRAKQLEGTLIGLVEGEREVFALDIEGDRVEIPLEEVAAARLVITW